MRYFQSILMLCSLTLMNTLLSCAALASDAFTQTLDVQFRADDRSSQDLRYQYRARYYADYQLTQAWSAHTFVVTGDSFGSSHNTFDDNSADYIYVRRIYARHEGDYGKTEVGILPTYKGRVSSSGLSKDGWIKGLRHVRNMNGNKLEFVVGQLDSLDARDALSGIGKLDYFEAEYSARLNELLSYELSFERMTQANFVRTELRFDLADSSTLFTEVVTRVNNSKLKFVLGVDGAFDIGGYPLDYFAHYSFVSNTFGLRAELTEDFLGSGNGISSEISGNVATSFARVLQAQDVDWFLRFDKANSQTRLMAGIKWSFQ